MNKIVLFTFYILMMYFILSRAWKAWKNASLKEKEDAARQIVSEAEKVDTLEKTYTGLDEKAKKVNQFKKKNL